MIVEQFNEARITDIEDRVVIKHNVTVYENWVKYDSEFGYRVVPVRVVKSVESVQVES